MFRNNFQRLTQWLSSDIGIDLGTANTLVYLSGRGIILNEPSVVAINNKTGRVVAVGAQAKAMLGRTPAHIQAIRPLTEGVISDFEVAEEMMSYLINKASRQGKRFLGPRVVIGVPSGITNVESRAVRDAARGAGARAVYIVEEPMAAAVGVRLPVHEPIGSMVVDIGGGNTDIAVISLGGIVRSRNVRIAGDKFNSDIIAYIRNEFKILIGETTAEQVKIAIGTVTKPSEPLEAAVRGRDLITGLPREVIITDSDIREAISGSVDILIESVREVLETTPPEILADVMRRGIHLVGGGALLKGLQELFEEWLKLPVYMADSPLTAVARGTGVIIEDLESYMDVLLPEDQALPPQE
jgi:rod shape-determining protein MreB